ncbi:MAG: Rrf2 family transcriptional regulator [Candidatus Binatia bacterium]
MALLNHTCTYAIRAALHVAAAQPEPGTFVSTRRIADDLGVPFAFLTKVLQGLTQSGILLSQRGASGGVALARPAEGITLRDIVDSVGGDGIFRQCLLGLPSCSDASPCALHVPWKEERSRLESIFGRTTLADLAGADAANPIVETISPAVTRRRSPTQTRRTT